MSGKDRNFAKTDSEAKRKKVLENEKEEGREREKIIDFLSGDAYTITDNAPIVRRLFSKSVVLKNITVNVESLSQPMVDLVIKRTQGKISETTNIGLEEGFNQVDTEVKIPKGCVVSVYADYPGDFLIEDLLFTSEITNK